VSKVGEIRFREGLYSAYGRACSGIASFPAPFSAQMAQRPLETPYIAATGHPVLLSRYDRLINIQRIPNGHVRARR